MIKDKIKKRMETFKNRTLYKIEEVYNNGSTYHGYYVESKAGKGQAYRYKTVIDDIVNIEDNNALNKARNTLRNGFSF